MVQIVGVRNIRVAAYSKNAAAINFYKKSGFNDFGVMLEADLK